MPASATVRCIRHAPLTCVDWILNCVQVAEQTDGKKMGRHSGRAGEDSEGRMCVLRTIPLLWENQKRGKEVRQKDYGS